jgi:excisionase family DNA binding protein
MPKTITGPRPTAADLLGEPTTVSLGRACQYLGVSRSVGYQLAKDGLFPVRVERIGNSYRIPTAGLIDYLGVRPDAPGEPSPAVAEPEPAGHGLLLGAHAD